MIAITLSSSYLILNARTQKAHTYVSQGSVDDSYVKNPEKATEIGVKGYILITLTDENQKEVVLQKGQDVHISYNIQFIAHKIDASDAYILFDTESDTGLVIEQSTGIEKGSIRINDYVTYDTNKVTLHNGENKTITLTMNLPESIRTVDNLMIPLRLVGASSNYIIIDQTEVNLVVN
jgi:hypothetical protein